jgi:uncharacterized protein
MTGESCTDEVEQAFVDHVMSPEFPCVAARSAVNRSRFRFHALDRLASGEATIGLCAALYSFLDTFEVPGTDPVTFVSSFKWGGADEAEFERLLWKQLQQLHDLDRQFFAWDASVSSDPASDRFSFSIRGRGLFVVGLHPHASRLSRRAPVPMLVFNLHEQFEDLRTSGKYGSMQKVIRKRDEALQGSINPTLASFGQASEALQYSGRAAAPDWQCPFKPGVGK